MSPYVYSTVLLVAVLLFSCSGNERDSDKAKFYDQHLIDFLNDNLNEAIIQDGFSPPVASRIYAYVNLAAYEGYFFQDKGRLDLNRVLNNYEAVLPGKKDLIFDREFTMFVAFVATAYELVYRGNVIDSLIIPHKSNYQAKLTAEAYGNSERLGQQIAQTVLAYAAGDMYLETRSYPLFEISGLPGSWEPTPPYYGSAIEPHWGLLRPFFEMEQDSVIVPQHLQFDTVPGSDFYNLNMEVYLAGMAASAEDTTVAMYWDGDPMPPKRIKRINLIKRQLNPTGHWLAIGKMLNTQQKKNEGESVTTYLAVSLAMADAIIAGWRNKYHYDIIRPHTYIGRYIDSGWRPILVTPLFPEYPSGHSVISGAASEMLESIFGEGVAFVDSSQVRFGRPARSYESIAEAAQECAESRVQGGVHYRPAVEEGLKMGRRIAASQHSAYTHVGN